MVGESAESEEAVTRQGAQQYLEGLLYQLGQMSQGVFRAVKNEYIAKDNPILGLDSNLAPKELREEVSERLLCQLERTEKGAFLYKPRDCRIDEKFRVLLRLGFEEFLHVPLCRLWEAATCTGRTGSAVTDIRY